MQGATSRISVSRGWVRSRVVGRVSAEITPVGKDSRQGSSQCRSPRPGEESHACGHRRKHRGRGRRLDGTGTPRARVHVQAPGVFLDDTEQPCGFQLQAMFSVLRRCWVHFGKRQQWGVPSEVSHHVDSEGEWAGLKMPK